VGAQQSDPAATTQQPPIMRIELKDTYKQASQQSSADLQALRSVLPELAPDIDPAITAEIYNELTHAGSLLKQCSAVLPGKTPEEAQSLVTEVKQNPLVEDAWVDAPQPSESEALGASLTFSARAGESIGDLSNRQYYLQDPVPADGYVIGGLNSLAARAYPGGDGSQIRLIVSSQYENWQHPLLPGPSPKLRLPTCWGTRPFLNPLGGILFAPDKGAGMTGMLPKARGAGVINTATDIGLVQLIQGNYVRPGDVVVIEEGRFRDNVNDPGPNCRVPEDVPSDQMFYCKLPIPSGRPSTIETHSSVLKWATEEHGIHVVIDADANWSPNKQQAYTINLDDPFFQDRYNRNVNDNGAIYVGAVDPATGGPYDRGPGYHSLHVLATGGSRIDLFGWSRHVFTLAPTSNTQHDNYIVGGATYLSAGMVAGAVAQVQSIAFAAGLGPIPPKHMREVLVETGHPLPSPDPAHPMGVMPDVVAAAEKLLNEYDSSLPGAPIQATLHGPDIVTMGKPELFWVSPSPPGEYSYAWTRPAGFDGELPNADKVTLAAPVKPASYSEMLKVTVAKQGSEPVTLSKPVLVVVPRLEGNIVGEDHVPSHSSQIFTAHVDNAPSDKPVHYRWSLPPGFAANSLDTAQIKVTAPKVEADTVAKLGVLVQTSAVDAVTMYKDVVVTAPQAAHASISGPATVAAGQPISLNGTLTGAPTPHNYVWLAEHFKPAASSGQAAQFTAPDTPGSYQVSLTAYGTDGKPVTALHTITVTQPTEEGGNEPITGQLDIPSQVHAGQLFSVSITARSTTGKPLTYDWKWMGDSAEPKGPKFIGKGANGHDTMKVQVSEEVKQDIHAYIRVVVSDGVNEKNFQQDVLIKANGG
jgi:hypothetical protein